MKAREWIPYAMVWFRLALAPIFAANYFIDGPAWVYVVALLGGMISDIYDGVLARRWGTSTPLLRRCDSNVDTIFYGFAGTVAVLHQAAWLSPWRYGIALMFLLMVAQNVINGVKFRQQPAYHMWSGKLWSIVLVIALISLFVNTPSAWAVTGLIVLGIYNSIEGIIASLILPKPMVDIPTVFHAMRIAANEKAESQRRS
jgi:CDP-diacylglycerol---glycerol-3-phosphate 3-phosphatidyltransferase